jgi:exodeoxyribonuclease-3
MTLSILSYNILYGGEDRLPLIAGVIQKQQPDVVAFLEANSHANAEALARQVGMDLTFGEANSEFHVAWLSHLPLIRTENYRLPVFTKTLLKIEIRWEGVPLALFATHLRAGRDQESDQYRVAEMQAILDILRQLGNQPHALVGDLNSLHPTDHPNLSAYLVTEPEERRENLQEDQLPRQVIPLLVEDGYVDCYRALHPTAPGYTYKLPDPALRLDYIFASPPLARRLHACDVVTGAEAEMASDHFPIRAEFGDEVAKNLGERR